MNIIVGFFSLATLKSCLTVFSDSPCHFDTTSAEEMEMNVAFASVATAFAK
jgi:hypothetical protein